MYKGTVTKYHMLCQNLGFTQLKRILKNLLTSAFQSTIQSAKKEYFKRHVECISSYVSLNFATDTISTAAESVEPTLSDLFLVAISERRSHCKHYNDVLGVINFCVNFLGSKSIVGLSKDMCDNEAFLLLWTTVIETVAELADTFCELVLHYM